MSYVVQIWEQPADLPMPDNPSDVWKMLEQLFKRSPPGQNPRYVELGRRLLAMFPEADDADGDFWLDGVDGVTDDVVWNLGLYCGDRLDEAQATIALQATALGLNLAAEGGGDLYLADGRMYTVHDLRRSRALAASSVPPAPPAPPSPPAGPLSAAVVGLMRDAEGGDADARFDLGCRYKTGDGVPRDDAQALRWWGLAAAQGMRDAQFNLGVAYFFGEGFVKDEVKAYELYGLAADAGHPEAIYNLGVMHMQGRTVRKDPIAAKALFLMARAHGSVNAKAPEYELGEVTRVMALASILKGGQVRRILATDPLSLRSPPSARPAAAPPGALAPAPASTPTPTPARRQTQTPTRATPQATVSSPVTVQPAARAESKSESTWTGWHRGHAALVLGVVSFPAILLLAPASRPGTLKLLAAALLLAGVYGVWRSTGDLDFSLPARLAWSLLALLPGIGVFVCLYMLIRVFRVRQH